jgi:BMFP domain-containing protein YqiC
VVQREDFEAVREMAIRARAENTALLARIEALEALVGAKEKAPGDTLEKPAASGGGRTKKT